MIGCLLMQFICFLSDTKYQTCDWWFVKSLFVQVASTVKFVIGCLLIQCICLCCTKCQTFDWLFVNSLFVQVAQNTSIKFLIIKSVVQRVNNIFLVFFV